MIQTTQVHVRGSSKNSVIIELIDSTTNAQVTGKVAANITASVGRWRNGLDTITPVDLANALSTHTTGGWKELHSVRMPGLYRLDIPDFAFTNDGISDMLLVAVTCAGCKPVYLVLPLVDIDPSPNTRVR